MRFSMHIASRHLGATGAASSGVGGVRGRTVAKGTRAAVDQVHDEAQQQDKESEHRVGIWRRELGEETAVVLPLIGAAIATV